MKIAYIFRKKNPAFFSIERVFAMIIGEIDKTATLQNIYAPVSSISWQNIRAIKKAARAAKADLYHITGHIHYAVWALPRRRTILTIHDCVFLRRKKDWRRLLLKKLLLDWPVSRVPLITTISEATKKDIIEKTGCPSDKIVVIPNPVSSLVTYKPRDFQTGQPVLLFIGSTPNKNLVRVIPALEGLSCRLHVVGQIPDPEKDLLAKHRIDYQQSEGLTDEEMAEAYINCDIVLFPSLFEGFGLPIVEGQQAGRVVLTSDLSPMKEVAGDAACLVDPDSIESIRKGIVSLIGDPGYRQRLIEAGFTNAARFTAGNITRQYLDVYHKLLTSL